jgi:hypothetical protein
MKKVKQERAFERSYTPVVVWFDQLAELVAVMKETGKEVLITAEDYQFDTIKEMREHFGARPLLNLKVSMTSPFAYLEFNRVWAKAYVSSGPYAPKLFFELDDILSPCQRKPTFLYSMWWMFVAGMGNYFLLDHFFSRETAANTLFRTTILVLSALFGPWAVWVGFIRTTRTSVIRLQRRVEIKPFFERNKDQLLLLIIGALIGGAVTFGGVVLKEQFYPSATVASPKQ